MWCRRSNAGGRSTLSSNVISFLRAKEVVSASRQWPEHVLPLVPSASLALSCAGRACLVIDSWNRALLPLFDECRPVLALLLELWFLLAAYRGLAAY